MQLKYWKNFLNLRPHFLAPDSRLEPHHRSLSDKAVPANTNFSAPAPLVVVHQKKCALPSTSGEGALEQARKLQDAQAEKLTS